MAVWQRYPVTGFRKRGMMVKMIALPLTRADAPIIVVWVRLGLERRPHLFAHAFQAMLGRCVIGMERVFAFLLV